MRMHALDTKLQREVALMLIAAPQQPRLVSTGTSPSENVLHFAAARRIVPETVQL